MSSDSEKSEFTKYLLAIMVFAFIFSSISGILFMSNRYNILISKRKKMNINEFASILNNEKRTMYSLNLSEAQLAALNSKEFAFSILNKVIYSKVVDINIEDLGIQKPRELVMDSILVDEYFQEDGKFNINRFEELLTKYNVAEQDYLKLVQDSQNKKFLFETLGKAVLLNKMTLNMAMAEANSYKNVVIFSINKSKLPSYRGEIKPEEVEHYYNNNINKFMAPERREIKYIKLTNYAKEQAEEIKTLRRGGAKLEDMAKKFGLAVENLGFIVEEQIQNEEEYRWLTNAFSMKEGEVSYLRRVDGDGYVYSVSSIEGSKVKDLADVKNEVIEAIREGKTASLRENLLKEQREKYDKNRNNVDMLMSYGFSSRRVDRLNSRATGYNEEFLKEVMNAKNGSLSAVYSDDKTFYFAHIVGGGVFEKNQKQYTNIQTLEEKIRNSMGENVLSDYLNYLRFDKYKIKINGKLLDLLK